MEVKAPQMTGDIHHFAERLQSNASHYDLVLMDVQMPVMEATQPPAFVARLQRLREDKAGSGCAWTKQRRSPA